MLEAKKASKHVWRYRMARLGRNLKRELGSWGRHMGGDWRCMAIAGRNEAQMKLIGVLLVLNGIVLTAWWITTQDSHKASVISLCLIAVFAGLALVLQDRLTELTVKGVGTIKSATEQVQTDAKTVADLRERVENQSATVDLVAKEASKAKAISEEVAEKNRRAEEKLDTLDQAIAKANAALARLDAATEFTMVVVAAQNDDRTAFDTLKKWSGDKSNPFSARAQQAWNTVFESHSQPMYLSNLTVPWAEGFDPSRLSLLELSQQYHGAPTSLKTALIEYISKREDIPKVYRLDFVIDVMKRDGAGICWKVFHCWDWAEDQAYGSRVSGGLVGEAQIGI
jgi:hypothetical protein